MGATLLKEAARKTVQEAGDGTTTATVLAHSILTEAYKNLDKDNTRNIKDHLLTDHFLHIHIIPYYPQNQYFGPVH